MMMMMKTLSLYIMILLITSCSLNNTKTAKVREPESDQAAFIIKDQDPAVINFKNYKIESNGFWLDGKGEASIENNGRTLRLEGDAWRRITFPYTVTKNTVIEFDYVSNQQGRIQGIGLAKTNYPNSRFLYELYGTEGWGFNTHYNYKNYAPSLKHYVIPIGKKFRGEYPYLIFANDDDDKQGAVSSFHNVKIYEKGEKPKISEKKQDTIDFNSYKIQSYGFWLDGNGDTSIENNGSTLRIKGDGWRKISFPYTVTKNTIIEFDFASNQQGRIQGIGLAKGNYPNSRFLYELYGTDKWGFKTHFDYKNSAPGLKHYVIPIGKEFRGEYPYLIFANDDDNEQGAVSIFQNVKIYEKEKTLNISEDVKTLKISKKVVIPSVSKKVNTSKINKKRVIPKVNKKIKTHKAEITSIKIKGLNKKIDTPITFGQPFSKGDVPAGYTLAAQNEYGDVINIQVDKKVTYQDGSLRHAIISTILHNTSGSSLALYTVPDKLKKISTTATSEALNSGVSVRMKLFVNNILYTADLNHAAISSPNRTWLNGSVVNEWQFKLPFVTTEDLEHPHLMARVNLRKYNEIDNVRIDITIENGWTFVKKPKNINYNAQFFINGQSVYEKTDLTHYHHTRWRKIFWTKNNPNIHIEHDTAYLIATKAVPNYDQSVVISEKTISKQYNKWLTSEHSPMDISFVNPYMPATAGRPDIGPLPMWAVTYLLSMDERAKEVMLGIGDLSGSWPIYYRDKSTDQPVSIEQYPKVSIYKRTINKGINALPICEETNCKVPYTVDSAHQPSFTFLPYLVTGDLYYLESLQFWANLNVINLPQAFRDGSLGLFHRGQVRSQAWSLRTLGQAIAFTPDDDAIKDYFQRILSNNLDVYRKILINDENNQLSIVPSGYAFAYNKGRGISTWQDAFFTWSTGYLVELGFEEAKPLFAWKTKSPLSMMTDPNFCWLMSSLYSLNVRDLSDSKSFRSNPTDQQPNYHLYTTFSKVYQESVPEEIVGLECDSSEMLETYKRLSSQGRVKSHHAMTAHNTMLGYPSSVMGYPANFQPALAISVDYLGEIKGLEIWRKFDNRDNKPDYSTNPVWAIKPRVLSTVIN